MDLGQETVNRIRFYRNSSISLMVMILAPLAFGVLLSAAMLIAAIAQGRCWLFESISDFSTPLAIFATVAILALFAGFAAYRVRARSINNRKDFYRETDYDPAGYASFRSALEGVSVGMGIPTPDLEVLGVPTVNSIAFRDKGKASVGVTAEALKAGLSRHEQEAMMAHELSHIVLGDYFLASSSAGFENAAYGMGILLLLMAVLVTVAINVYVLAFLVPPGIPLGVVMVDTRLRKKTRILYRHNDLLADTIAAKLTSDPEALRKTIEKLWDLSEETRAHIPATAHFQSYLFVARPLETGPVKMVTYDGASAAASAGSQSSSTKIYWVPGQSHTESRTWFAYDSVNQRVGNLKEIENGHWTELERLNQREKARNIAGLATAGLIMAIVILALFVPVNGTTAWHEATTDVVWKTGGGK
ncbi:MAG TPA: M48 family metalloprotease [Candidatus Anoxymicrobiaceae bacterium]